MVVPDLTTYFHRFARGTVAGSNSSGRLSPRLGVVVAIPKWKWDPADIVVQHHRVRRRERQFDGRSRFCIRRVEFMCAIAVNLYSRVANLRVQQSAKLVRGWHIISYTIVCPMPAFAAL